MAKVKRAEVAQDPLYKAGVPLAHFVHRSSEPTASVTCINAHTFTTTNQDIAYCPTCRVMVVMIW